jgi:endonuclease/exonuclease/phosphatase family metal-dependent hydrolase
VPGSSLSFVSWNLAMFEPSAEAPLSWEVFDTEAAVRELVLAAAPDVVLYQELPGLVPFVETHDMIKANPRTHNGNLATLVTHELAASAPGFTVVEGCAVLATFADPAVTVANVHLAPGRGAAGERLDQLARIVEASPTEALVVIGDTNTRVAEAELLAEAGLHGARPPRPTWDSRRNRFRTGMAEFAAYFTRWFASPDVAVTDVRVWHEPLERLGHRFHLSDHYALSGVIHLDPVSG